MADPRNPKDQKHGRQVAKKLAGATVLPPRRKGRAPDYKTEQPISDEGRAYWTTLWQTPQSTQWGKAEIYTATRLLLAFEKQRDDGFSPNVSTEMRQLEDVLGLSPKAMKAYGWVIGEPEEAPAKTSRAKDRYSHLRAVGD
jgi:hypothetical protein